MKTLKDFARDCLPEEKLRELDARDEFPEEIVRDMGGVKLGLQLMFIPEAYGGMDGGALDIYRVCEELGRIDLGIATGVLATVLGSDPIVVGGTPEQKQRWLGHIADVLYERAPETT